MSRLVELDPTEVIQFVSEAEPAVLFLSLHARHRFSARLRERFAQAFASGARFGYLPLTSLLMSPSPALAFLLREVELCGQRDRAPSLPCYSLFRSGRMLAWETGLPALEDLERIVRGSLPGIALSLLTGRLEFFHQALFLTADEAAAERIAL